MLESITGHFLALLPQLRSIKGATSLNEPKEALNEAQGFIMEPKDRGTRGRNRVTR